MDAMLGGTISVTVRVPVALSGPDTSEHARRLLVLDAVRTGILSPRAAARELDLGLPDFMDLAREHGVPLVRPNLDDLRQDLAAIDRLGRSKPARE